ncbi:carbamoyl-phosphate synthase small subunit [Alkalispirochaeta sphaeroplastigenens]|uniref:Carbamoyl phosphate synthase small chain n=1 Tax=Alkalispirochaeta sphaeroplastigenens TaxID=1187066 RepID=A0A2S4K1L7_9SPIO|nr:glutamine-hydrolyzing carbamoyl-phosphate synthase small subunit [Alkalispirochaeta sphaeroplastigenens]POR05655.1 carbamoyl-phosphate synthase small subunit [Alkalispirochaeta sphaeroplastigenens]
MDHALLILSDGTVFPGRSFGAPAPALKDLATAAAPGGCETGEGGRPSFSRRLHDIGEVVFNTAMSGYGEVLTDPSYTGQIVVMTYPHAGNYGIDEAWSETGPQEGRSGSALARTVKPAALIVRSLYEGPVPEGRIKLADYLARNGITGITGLDTRALTLNLRRHGSRNGLICRPARGRELCQEEKELALELLRAFPAMEGRSLVDTVGTGKGVHLPPPSGSHQGPHIVVYDCGAKANILREFHDLGCPITLLPASATAEEILAARGDAVMISNGPGDPAVLSHQVEQVRQLMGRVPLLGICLGHQIIAEAAGAETFKMKFGHHGVNHPVREEVWQGDRERGRVFVTSQNHGFAVREESLPPGMAVWFRNANDGTVEGLWDEERRLRTAQFHPESAPGPIDSRWIFSAFLEVI